MTKMIANFACAAALFLALIASVPGQLNIQAIDVAGDSISKGFNAASQFPCSNGDQEQFNWMTSDTHGTSLCGRGPENVFSFTERLECDLNTNIIAANPNRAASGARMLSDFVNQANGMRTFLNAQQNPRLAAVFLGHNDGCSTTLTKVNASCPTADQDQNNYCRTRNDAFEREFRKGLDILVTVANTRIGVSSPVRVSQLCNFGSKSNCQLIGNCTFLWNSVNICGSMTRGCSDAQVIDAYNTMKGFREIMKRVSADYAAVPEGGQTPVVMIGGEMVGGSTKAAGTHFVYSDAAWFYRFNSEQISCCDCFHPSALGQDTLARFAKDGLTCSKTAPCCRETGDPLSDAKCLTNERKRTFYRGIY